MKRFIYFAVFFILLFVLSIVLINTDQKAQTTKDQPGSAMRAANGDTVWVLLNHIKADKCKQFEKFVHEIFWGEATSLDAADQQAFRQTRVLHPVEMNKDSTYTYIFLMDPVITGRSYKISYYLKKMYSEEKAKEYGKMLNDCYASPQTGYVVVQSQH